MEFAACGTAVVAQTAGPAASAYVQAKPPISALPVSLPISAHLVKSASSSSALSRLDAMPSAEFSCEECVDFLLLVTSFVPKM